MIPSLLGVDDTTIEEDYSLSEEGIAAWRPALEGILFRQEPWLRREEVQRVLNVRLVLSSLLGLR